MDEINERLLRIENKLDSYLTRTSAVEIDLKWIKGFSKIAATAFATVITGIILFYIQNN